MIYENKNMSEEGFDVYVSMVDTQSFNSMLCIMSSYTTEANLRFDDEGIESSFSTSDFSAFITYECDKHNLLEYFFRSRKTYDVKYLGFNIKKFIGSLGKPPAKSSTKIYRMIDDDNLYISHDSSSNTQGASKVPSLDLPIDDREPPSIEHENKYFKVSTSEFSDICVSFVKSQCPTVQFIMSENLVTMKGFNDTSECMGAYAFKANSSPSIEGEPEDDLPIAKKKGKFNVIVHKKDPGEAFSVNVTIDKLKPLTKLNNLCKNGIVYIYTCKKSETTNKNNIIALRTNVGQVGVFTLYLKDREF